MGIPEQTYEGLCVVFILNKKKQHYCFHLDAPFFFMVDMSNRLFLTVRWKTDSASFPSSLGHPEGNFLSFPDRG